MIKRAWSAIRDLLPSKLLYLGANTPLSPILRKDAAADGRAWVPLVFVLAAIGAVAYADHMVVSISLVYLYIFPLSVGAILLRPRLSYSLIVVCILFHDYYSPRTIRPGIRFFHNVSAALCFAFIVFLIQRYIRERELLANTVQQQRDELLRDVELAAQVQRLFLLVGKPAIPGLEISGMMRPARGVGGDYYDYSPIGKHAIEIVIADVAGKGVPAALLMSATAAATQLGTGADRTLLEMVGRLNTEIHSVSDAEHYVTFLVAEINAQKRTLQYVNCGHNPALLFRAETGRVTRLDSSCAPIGIAPVQTCELATANLAAGDVLVLYTDGVSEAMNSSGEEFGTKRISDSIQSGYSLSAEGLMNKIYDGAADFCQQVGFQDDVTILVVRCNFDADTVATSAGVMQQDESMFRQSADGQSV